MVETEVPPIAPIVDEALSFTVLTVELAIGAERGLEIVAADRAVFRSASGVLMLVDTPVELLMLAVPVPNVMLSAVPPAVAPIVQRLALETTRGVGAVVC